MMDGPYIERFLGVGSCELSGMRSEACADGAVQEDYELSYNGPVPGACPRCGGRLHKHGTRTVRAAATPVMGHRVQLEIRYPRRRCPECGFTWKPDIEGLDEEHMMTRAAYADIAQRSLRTTFREVARDYPVSHVTVRNVFEEFVDENAALLRFRVPAFLGIDEKNLKRIGMVTVITDVEHRTVFDMIEGRRQADLDAYFSELEGLEAVRWVASDMYRPFWKSIARYTPNATWVIDRFHVVKGANDALDTVRKGLQAGLDRTGRLRLKKNLAYTLRRRSRDLSAAQAAEIRALRADGRWDVLVEAYDLKEAFFDIYDGNLGAARERAEASFESWEASIPADAAFESFRRLARTVENHREYIFNWWDCPIQVSNGFTECTNRLIKETDMKGRGYSFKVLRARTLYRHQNLQRLMESGGAALGPRLDTPNLFTTEPTEPQVVTDSESGLSVDARTGEIVG